LQLRPDVLDVVWGIFDEDGDGRLTKAEFMDVSGVLCRVKLCAAFFTLSLGARGAGVAWGQQEEP
jgi:hypothetical protein